MAAATERDVEQWRGNLLAEDEEIGALLARTKRIAVLGMRTEAHPERPAFYVPRYLVGVGLEVIPVPVHHPDAVSILGQQVYFKLADIPGEIDLVDVFRRAEDIPAHLDDILRKRPRAVWFQSGIRNDEAAERLARAGIKVVQDRCLMIEHGRLSRR